MNQLINVLFRRCLDIRYYNKRNINKTFLNMLRENLKYRETNLRFETSYSQLCHDLQLHVDCGI